jgi:hypothetical protein
MANRFLLAIKSKPLFPKEKTILQFSWQTKKPSLIKKLMKAFYEFTIRIRRYLVQRQWCLLQLLFGYNNLLL